jgi:hypothetical protein
MFKFAIKLGIVGCNKVVIRITWEQGMRGLLVFVFAMLISFNGLARYEVREDPVELYHFNSGGHIVHRANLDDNGYWKIGTPGSVLIVPTSGYYFTLCNKVRTCDPSGYCWMQQHCN